MPSCGFIGVVRVRTGPLRLVLVGLALCAALAVFSPSSGNASNKSFASGTLIIPMDTDTAGNHASFNQNSGMWKAYGLVYKLLQNGIPVQWAIATSKTSTSDIDFSALSVSDKRTGTALGSWDYRGGPFIVDKRDAAPGKSRTYARGLGKACLVPKDITKAWQRVGLLPVQI